MTRARGLDRFLKASRALSVFRSWVTAIPMITRTKERRRVPSTKSPRMK